MHRTLKMSTVWADENKGQAIAVSDQVKLTKPQPDGQDKGHLTFALVKTGDKWQVKDIDFRSDEKAKDQVDRFKKKYPGAKELRAKSGS